MRSDGEQAPDHLYVSKETRGKSDAYHSRRPTEKLPLLESELRPTLHSTPYRGCMKTCTQVASLRGDKFAESPSHSVSLYSHL
jgi:hypothetical protein